MHHIIDISLVAVQCIKLKRIKTPRILIKKANLFPPRQLVTQSVKGNAILDRQNFCRMRYKIGKIKRRRYFAIHILKLFTMEIFLATQKYISVASALAALILHSKPRRAKGSPPWLQAENLGCNSRRTEIYIKLTFSYNRFVAYLML